MSKCRWCPSRTSIDEVSGCCITCLRSGFAGAVEHNGIIHKRVMHSRECDNCSRTAVSGYPLCKSCYQNQKQQKFLAQQCQAQPQQVVMFQKQPFAHPQQFVVIQQQKKCKNCQFPAAPGHSLCNGCHSKKVNRAQQGQVFVVHGGRVFAVQQNQDVDEDLVGFYQRPRMYM